MIELPGVSFPARDRLYRSDREKGLSLIELMVALALGLIIVAALAQLFVNISRTNLEMAKTNSQIENARFAMQFLQNDIVHAGYWGGYVPDYDNLAFEIVPTDAPSEKPDPCTAFTTSDWDDSYINSVLGLPVEVYSAVPGDCGGIVLDRLDDTDILIVRHADTLADTCAIDGTPCDPGLYMQVSNCASEIATTPYALDPNYPVLTQLDCITPEVRRRYIQNLYYVRDWAYEDDPKDGIPTLVRSEFDVSGSVINHQTPEPLVEGIERFHVEVGIDRESYSGALVKLDEAIDWGPDDSDRTYPRNRGDGVAEARFERCLSNEPGCTLADLANVVAVKIYVLARANEASAGYVDSKNYVLGGTPPDVSDLPGGFKRHVFSSTVRLNNISGRRDAPYDPNGP